MYGAVPSLGNENGFLSKSVKTVSFKFVILEDFSSFQKRSEMESVRKL